jgi:hypothetical protein
LKAVPRPGFGLGITAVFGFSKKIWHFLSFLMSIGTSFQTVYIDAAYQSAGIPLIFSPQSHHILVLKIALFLDMFKRKELTIAGYLEPLKGLRRPIYLNRIIFFTPM